jgi:hypothetical protein
MALAAQLAVLIAQTRRQAGLQEALAEERLLHRLALALVAAPDLATMLAQLAAALQPLGLADRLFLLEGEALEVLGALSGTGQSLLATEHAFSRSVARWVYEHAKPLHLLDAQSDDAFKERQSIAALGLSTIFAAPVEAAGQPRRVLYLDSQSALETGSGALRTLVGAAEIVAAWLSR